MLKKKRFEEINKLLLVKDFVYIEELAEMFDVSEMTVRRDLLELEDKGFLIRATGGAYLKKAIDQEVSIAKKKMLNAGKKEKIAKEAIKLVKDDMTIFIDSGSTCLSLATEIKRKSYRNLNIITQDLSIINELKNVDGIRMIILGGVLSKETFSMNGLLTEVCIKQLRAEMAFLGTSSISENLVMHTPDEQKAKIKRLLIENSNESALLVDSSKFSATSLYYIESATAFDYVISDKELSFEQMKKLKDADVNYIKV